MNPSQELEQHVRDIEVYLEDPQYEAASDALMSDAFHMREALSRYEKAQRLKVVSLADFLKVPPTPPDYLIEGILGSGDIVNLSGPWKLGKTWLALDLALAVADETQSSFLGRDVSRHGPVLYCDSENGEAIMHERLHLLVNGKVPADFFLHSNFGFPMLDEKADVDVLRAWVMVHRPVLVVFDSMVRFHTQDENSATQMANVFKAVAPLSRELGAAILFLDHQGHDNKTRARGSGEKLAQVDRIWTLEGQPGRNQFIWKHGPTRRGRSPEPQKLLLDDCREGEIHLRLDDPPSPQRDDEVTALLRHLDGVGRDYQSHIAATVFAGRMNAARRSITKAVAARLLKAEVQEGRKRMYSLTAHGAETLRSEIDHAPPVAA